MDHRNDFKDWTTGGQEGLHHVIDFVEDGLPSPYLDVPQLFDGLSGHGEKAALQINDPSILPLFNRTALLCTTLISIRTKSHPPSKRCTSLPDTLLSVSIHKTYHYSNHQAKCPHSPNPPLRRLPLTPRISHCRHLSQDPPTTENHYILMHLVLTRNQSRTDTNHPLSVQSLADTRSESRDWASRRLGTKRLESKKRLKSEFPKFSKRFFAHLELLVENEIDDGNLDADFDEMSLATSTQEPSLASEMLEPGNLTEAGSPVSLTPRAPNFDAREDGTMNSEPEEHVRYYCTFPGCKVSQKDCKYQHRRCQCPTKLGTYWSNHKADIKRHEGKNDHWRQDIYVCLQCFVVTDLFGNSSCLFCSMALRDDPKVHFLHCERASANSKTFGRKDHLLGHLQKHHELRDMGEVVKTWSLPSGTDWPKECGFCGIIFTSWDKREAHVARHFEKGFKIQDWKLPFRGPEDRKPPSPLYPLYRKHNDDDDDDDDFYDDFFGGDGGNSYGKAFGKGYPALASQQSKQGQAYSTQGYGTSYPESHYQHGYGTAHSLVPNGLGYHEVERQPSWALGHVTLNIALERYLQSREDRVPALGAVPRAMYREIAHSQGRYQPMQTINLPWDKSMRTIVPGGGHEDKLWRSVITLQSLPARAETSLVRSYVSQHWQDLDRGVFWVNSKMRSETRNSFWDIATSAIPHHSMQHAMVMMLFNSWW